ncbi:cell division control protein 14 [Lineolata rhizophorae]|uniref:Cell division control protein 14 n=1 Tax=Lineolata rhizophorae TaxID=578093 RepID=A0A6A6NQG1_9PEZI|nr:cell division control protein 14 [Lineolata rhizophorae]
MEALLSLAFDNISSKDSSKIRKGLRQIDGLLAQICLSSKPSRSQLESQSPSKRRASAVPANRQASPPKRLRDLHGDPAFLEFFRLQEGFEWNVASRLVNCLERLMGMGNNGQSDLLILSTLDLLQGVLLLHPPSRTLFSREIHMNMLLDLLDSVNPPAIQSHAVLVLVTALLSVPRNTRVFEAADGLLAITSLFKSSGTVRSVKTRVVEFLYFYLMPEAPVQKGDSSKGGDRLKDMFSQEDEVDDEIMKYAKPTSEKTALLGRYLSNVEDLVQDLRENAPFGEIVI